MSDLKKTVERSVKMTGHAVDQYQSLMGSTEKLAVAMLGISQTLDIISIRAIALDAIEVYTFEMNERTHKREKFLAEMEQETGAENGEPTRNPRPESDPHGLTD